MALSKDLILQFVKATNDNKDHSEETTLYGTIVENGGVRYVRLDGSELLTGQYSEYLVISKLIR